MSKNTAKSKELNNIKSDDSQNTVDKYSKNKFSGTDNCQLLKRASRYFNWCFFIFGCGRMFYKFLQLNLLHFLLSRIHIIQRNIFYNLCLALEILSLILQIISDSKLIYACFMKKNSIYRFRKLTKSKIKINQLKSNC